MDEILVFEDILAFAILVAIAVILFVPIKMNRKKFRELLEAETQGPDEE